MSIVKRCMELGIPVVNGVIRGKHKTEIDPLECIECGEYRPDDERVKAGMKCGYCAYGSERNPETVNEDDIDR